MIHHLTRATKHLIFWGLCAMALAMTLVRFTLSVIDIYREDLERIISQEIEAPVKIARLGAGMRGFRPELLLKNVQVSATETAQKAPVSVQEIRLSMDLLKSYGQQPMLASSWITLVGADLTVLRRSDGSIGVKGLKASNAEPPYWLLHAAQFEILRSQIAWLDEMSPLKPIPAPKPLVFNNLNVVLNSDQNGQRHAIKMLVAPPKAYAKAVSVVMQLRGNFLAPQGVNGIIYMEGKDLQLANLLKVPLPLNLSVTAGVGNIQLWSFWKRSTLQAITGIDELQQAVLQRPAQSPLAIKQLSNRFNFKQEDGRWGVQLDRLSLNASALQVKDVKLGLDGLQTPTPKLQQLSLDVPQLDLQQAANVGQFLSLPLPMPAKAIQGQLTALHLALAPEAQQFNVQGAFDDVSIAAYQSIPGISHVSGRIQGNQQQGELSLALKASALDMPRIFAKPLPLDALNTTFKWQQTANDWLISSPKIVAGVPDLQTDSCLNLKINRQTQAIWMDLQTAFKGSTDIQAFGRYWPVGLMGKEAVTWLNQAFTKGRVSPRSVSFSGALADFPFTQKPGAFKLILDFKGVDLQYAADWQPAKAIDAEVMFHNDGLHISAQQASVAGAKMRQFDIGVPSFMTSPYLSVQVKGDPDIRQVLSFLQKSPVQNTVDRLLEVISPQGLAPLDVLVQVPLTDNSPIKVKGALQLQKVNLAVLPLSLPVQAAQGRIDFNEQGIIGGQLSAKTLGDAIHVVIHNNSERLQLDVTGHTDIVDLQQQFDLPIWHFAHGDGDYKLGLTLPQDLRPATLAFSSDLNGIALRLPDVLAKKAAENRPLTMQMTLGDNPLLPMSLRLGKSLKMAVLFNGKARQVAASELLIGAGELGELSAQEGRLALNLAECRLDEWLDLADVFSEHAQATAPFFKQIKLQAKQLLWQGQALGALNANMSYQADAWQIALDSTVLKGHIVKPAAIQQDKPMQLALDTINLSALGRLKPSAAPVNAKTTSQRLPLFSLNAQQILWDGVNVGTLTIETERVFNGLAFKPIKLKNARGSLDLTGDWLITPTGQQTRVAGTLQLQQFGGFLETLKLSKDVKGADAKADIAVNWQGAPQQFALERLQGKIGVELGNGRILSIEPGFGRLLGFLAFEQWGRRLRLDFSDMLSEGLTFNNIHGHFDLQRGDAVTDNLVIDAVPAIVDVKGVAHLAERSLDYHVKVLPKSSAALPIAGTIVDKVVTYGLEAITGNSQAGFLLGTEYKILGSWENPQVTRLHEKDGLLQKTWYGLTDFSWTNKKKPKQP